MADCWLVRAEYDVIVVGARIAGATLAALLGDAGASVLLIDRADFPSTTTSTHFFRSAAMVTVLDRLDVLTRVLELGCPPLTHQWTHLAGSAAPLDGPPQNPGDMGYCLSVRREPLDHILVERARRSPNVDFAPRTVVSDVHWEGDCVSGVTVRGWRRDPRAPGGRCRRTSLADRQEGQPADPGERAGIPRHVLQVCQRLSRGGWI
jgi:2-polyprenyl-6-methoxyphenol hydroxylase-like FAD-dependent oxidoreductase